MNPTAPKDPAAAAAAAAPLRASLRCPICRHELRAAADVLVCLASPDHAFPVVRGVPVLIHDGNSVFSVAELAAKNPTFFAPPSDSALIRFARRLLPSDGVNVTATQNFRVVAERLLAGTDAPRVLVIGGSIDGEGIGALTTNARIALVHTDVAWGPRVNVLCDIHNLPFADGSFDAVIAQAVLEHVVDPVAGVAEIARVLKPAGIVYAETPFMQQVHGGRYDFTRFTFLGHRRLFRQFEEIASGACCGPGMALGWAWQFFLTSFATGRTSRRALTFFARWTSFFLKYFDFFLVHRPRALDAASGYYFIGKKSDTPLTDRELLALYDRVEGRQIHRRHDTRITIVPSHLAPGAKVMSPESTPRAARCTASVVHVYGSRQMTGRESGAKITHSRKAPDAEIVMATSP